jgi:hypothetical protein
MDALARCREPNTIRAAFGERARGAGGLQERLDHACGEVAAGTRLGPTKALEDLRARHRIPPRRGGGSIPSVNSGGFP